MLDVRRLRVLREVASRGSFSAAAESLSYTQSAVSQQIAALERECATKLLERGPRGVRLTDAGRALVQHADAILARIEDAEEELAAIAGLRGGRLRIATFQSAGATLVPLAVGEFHRRHPGVDITVRQEEIEAVDMLMAGEVDMALVMDFDHAPHPAPDLDLTKLLDDTYDLVLPEGHARASRSVVDLAELAEERWICSTPNTGCREGVAHVCRAAGFEADIAIDSDENTQMQAFVASGLGIALIPRLGLSALHPGVAIKQLKGNPLTRRIYAATVADAYRSPATEAMIEILREVAVQFEERAALAVA